MPFPPVQERVEPRLLQKRPGRWTLRFRYAGQTRDVALGLTTDPVARGAPAPREVATLARKTYTLPYLRGEWSPFEDAPEAPRRGPTVAEAAARFLARYDESPQTRRAYESCLRLFEATLPSHTLVAEVAPDDVAAYVYRQPPPGQRAVSRATRLHAWTHLRSFFNWCRREGLIDQENPVERTDRPAVESRQPPFFMPAQLGALIEHAGRLTYRRLPADLVADAFAIALGVGLRREELRALQAADVNLELGYVEVRTKTAPRDGIDFRPKGRRDRRIRINPLAQPALARRLALASGPRDLLLGAVPSADGEAVRLREERLSKALPRAARAAGLHGRLTAHGLRGHYITYLLLLDWPVPLVQLLAGHADPNTTLGYWRDASMLLHGEGRARFREGAIALGFEPYGERAAAGR